MSLDLSLLVGNTNVRHLETTLKIDHRRLDLQALLTEGRTAAKVGHAMLSATPRAATQDAVACVVKYLPPGRDSVDEADRHSDAFKAGEEFQPQLSQMLAGRAPIVLADGGILMFYADAGSRTALSLHYSDDLVDLCRSVAAGVLGTWNPGFGYRPESASALLLDMLGGRLNPGRPLHTWLARRPELGPATLWTTVAGGARMINPHALAAGAFDPVTVSTLTGRTHGDLHLSNIVLHDEWSTSAPDRYKLIDLGGYEPDGPVARDPAHLVLSVVARHLPDLRDDARIALAEALVHPRGRTRLPAEIRDVARVMFAAGEVRADSKGRAKDWRQQWLLGYVAGGLSFAARDLPGDGAQQWFFDLAARAATAFLDAVGALPAEPKVIPAQRDGAVADAAAAAVVSTSLSEVIGTTERGPWNRLFNGLMPPALPGDGRDIQARVTAAEVEAFVAWCAREDRWDRLIEVLEKMRYGEEPLDRLRAAIGATFSR
ncbi:hypothetical protein ACFPIJ_61880 [Dactylosporangium cerinum]|uniref:Aminoglycoside phosphotransferase domain-containing protein n=1 Tax=Dactylosporangium cerinum TaxID=1434730 RepID=A0ABV9WMM2_9ACTN